MVGWGKTKIQPQPQLPNQLSAPKQAVNVSANNEIEDKFIEAIESMGISDIAKVYLNKYFYLQLIYHFYRRNN